MKKNVLAAMLLAISCALFSCAQEKTSNEDLSYLFPEPKSWDFGVQVSSGVEQVNYPNRPDNHVFNDSYFVSRLSFFTQYNIDEKSALRSEIGAGAFNRFAPTVSFQYAYQFAPRWTVYAGIGLDIDFNNTYLNASQDSGQRVINPRFQFGVRYQASKRIFFDLRYEQDILNRTKKQDLINSMGRFRTITLGAGFKF
ncbi:MAG: hypothetical protein ACSHWW_12425 [Nonlabens sp.]|uniref:hypothetical protein n=1 Tax=Nonlabens sp. TaxID=1888209 RepID=UPI003EFA4F62